MDGLLLVVGVLLAAAVGVWAFLLGDKRRRRASGQQGPRPTASIGEAIKLAAQKGGLVFILFLSDDEPGIKAASEMAEDPRILEALGQENLFHVIVRAARDGIEISQALYEKYAGGELPAGPSGVILDAEGRCLGIARSKERGPLPEWLPEFVSETPAHPAPEADEPSTSPNLPAQP